jgi:transcriptional regulator GlxA family with amidase domain
MVDESPIPVGILLWDGVEVLDFAGPVEVFSTAWSDADGKSQSHPLFDVITIGESDSQIACFGGLVVKPRATILNHPPIDVLVVPGGHVTGIVKNERVLQWIKQQDKKTRLTASVCTGALVLAKCGLLNRHKATTHWSAIDGLRKNYPEVDFQEKIRFVDEGHIITSAGISAGIDMSLHIVSRLCGRKVAEEAAQRMEYDWKSV